MITEPRPGYKNRHTDGLPDKTCVMQILILTDLRKDIYLCDWIPARDIPVSEFISDITGPGYLGTARVITGKYKGIGYHAWEQNDYEWVYYSLFSL